MEQLTSDFGHKETNLAVRNKQQESGPGNEAFKKTDSRRNTESKCTLEDEDPQVVFCSHEYIQTLIMEKTKPILYYMTKCWVPLVTEFKKYLKMKFNRCLDNYSKLEDLQKLKLVARFA